jgi:hypothetical protein
MSITHSIPPKLANWIAERTISNISKLFYCGRQFKFGATFHAYFPKSRIIVANTLI